jgi:hypothetical protein
MLNPGGDKHSRSNVDPYHDFESNNRAMKHDNMTAFEKEVERRLGRVGRLKQRVVSVRSATKKTENQVNFSEKRHIYLELDKHENRLNELETETYRASDAGFFARTNDQFDRDS